MRPGAQAPAAGPALTAVTCPALAGASAGIGTCGLGVPAARARAASLRGSSIRLEEGMGFSVLAGAGWALRGAPTTGRVESANTAATTAPTRPASARVGTGRAADRPFAGRAMARTGATGGIGTADELRLTRAFARAGARRGGDPFARAPVA